MSLAELGERLDTWVLEHQRLAGVVPLVALLGTALLYPDAGLAPLVAERAGVDLPSVSATSLVPVPVVVLGWYVYISNLVRAARRRECSACGAVTEDVAAGFCSWCGTPLPGEVVGPRLQGGGLDVGGDGLESGGGLLFGGLRSRLDRGGEESEESEEVTVTDGGGEEAEQLEVMVTLPARDGPPEALADHYGGDDAE